MKTFFKLILLTLIISSCGKAKLQGVESESLNFVPQIGNATSCTIQVNQGTNGAQVSSLVCPDGTSYVLDNGQTTPASESCSVAQVTVGNRSGTEISCPDGTSQVILDGADGTSGAGGSSCSATGVTVGGRSGTQISCSDGTSSIVYDGATGATGATGSAGSSCTVNSIIINNRAASEITCGDGTSVVVFDGANGSDGTTCSTSRVTISGRSGSQITCSDGTSSIVYDGTNGSDGNDGRDGADGRDGNDGRDGADGSDANFCDGTSATAFRITEVIDPCGDQSGHDEVFLKLCNGQLVAHLDNGEENQRLTIIEPGTYMTTDGTRCIFTLDTDGNVTW